MVCCYLLVLGFRKNKVKPGSLHGFHPDVDECLVLSKQQEKVDTVKVATLTMLYDNQSYVYIIPILTVHDHKSYALGF